MNKKLLFSIVGGVAGLGLIIAIAVSVAGGGGNPADAYGEVTVEGPNLPVYNDTGGDIAIGVVAPTVSGVDFDGSPVVIGPDGRAKVVVFMAHWCPHCQAEAPEVVAWMREGRKPAEVDFYAISTFVNRLQANYPPSEWLAREGWEIPTIQDDQANSGALAFGMRGTPFWVVLDGDNRVIMRAPGQIGERGMDVLFAAAAAAAEAAGS